MITSSRMIKYLALPLILVGCTAPVTDPPAHACSPRLDGKPTYCPDERDLILKPVELPKEQLRGEIEKNATKPDDAINNALAEFNYGSNGSTESEELLQLPSN